MGVRGLRFIRIYRGPELGPANTPGSASDIALAGAYVYIADGASGLRVLPAQCGAVLSAARPTVSTRLAIRVSPNPFRPPALLEYVLPERAQTGLRIYAVTGQLVRVLEPAAVREAGRHAVVWDGRDDRGRAMRPGLYFSSLDAGRERASLRILLMR